MDDLIKEEESVAFTLEARNFHPLLSEEL